MTMNAPPPEPIWDYRRATVAAAQKAVAAMLRRRAQKAAALAQKFF
jgi:hypothetical protein